jgi:rsbT co-antagonist protein RsbR
MTGTSSGARGMGEATASEYLALYRLTTDDLSRIKSFGKVARMRLDEIVIPWYEWLETQPEFEQFFADRELIERLKKLQTVYWQEFMDASVDEEYIASRRRVGETHARIGLPHTTYFAGLNMFLELFLKLLNSTKMTGDARYAMSESITKLIHLDTAVAIETINQLVEETLTAQTRSLMEMSTPVTEIWEGILLLPIVGLIDSKRAADVMHAALAKISDTQARIFILDISGVGIIDTAVANHLFKITRATRLMGCECTISGVSPTIAQTIVDLGIDVGEVNTTATMRDALANAFKQVGSQNTQAR